MSASSPIETFAQRGVHVPFTAPMLATARIRAARQGGIELVLSNPSGGKGVMVTDLAGASRLHGATLHDTLLCQRLASQGPPDPRLVREAALALAAEGHAGPAASIAARDRQDREAADQARTRAALLAGFPGGTTADAARVLCVAHAQAAQAIETLTILVAPLGAAASASDDAPPRLPAIAAGMAKSGSDIAAWAKEDPAHDADGMGAHVAILLTSAAAMAAAFLTGLRRHLADPVTLTRRALIRPLDVRAQIDRALWLLDGWERLSLLWQTAGTTALRRLALLEIAHGRPQLPTEALLWTDPAVIQTPEEPRLRITFGANTRLPPAALQLLTRRNEAMRAMSL